MRTSYAEAFGDLAVLPHAGEGLAVAEAGAGRRREFATARECARTALLRLGLPGDPVPADQDGVPVWPWGVIGSITHCPGYRAAVVTRTSGPLGVTGLGLDAEPHEPLPADALGLVAREDERGALAVLAARRADVHWDRLLFCVKEATFKATFPRTRRWLEFDEVATEIAPTGRFRATPGPGSSEVRGRWWVRRGVVLACGAIAS